MRYCIITYGCQMNQSDSERIATLLEEKNYLSTSKINEADLILVNMCSIRQSAVNRVYGLIQKFKKLKIKNPKLKTILTGCIVRKDRPKFAKGFDQILKFKNLLKYLPKYQYKPLAYIPISSGCNNACTYCVVPFTRGLLVCRDPKEIIKEVKNAIKNNCKEIWLLGQNVNDYQSGSLNFAGLLKMINKIPGDFKFLFTSPHPKPSTRAELGAGLVPHRNEVSGAGNFSWDELIDTLAKCEKFGRYLNLPVQSGDNQILKRMNRPYTAEQYKNLIKKIRQEIPDINLSTDIIVGFPGETNKQFKNTAKLFKETQFDMAYISQYSPRPGTAAFRMEDNVSLKEKKRRWKILNDILLKTINPRMNTKKPKLVVILGPTASGKSKLAIELAKKFNGEIISADSRQIYQGLNIGTAKPTKKDIKSVKHYLVDIKKPNQLYTVGQYRKEAIEIINNIIKKGKTPFLVGGTGLYIKSVVDNPEIPEVKPDRQLRKKFELKIKKQGLKSLYRELIKIDPEAAHIVDKNNPRRIIRALEIAIKTKKPFSQQRKMGKTLFNVLEIGIGKNLKEVRKRTEKRVDKMVKTGLIKEVKNLIKTYNKKLPTFDAIGYREIIGYLDNKFSLKEGIEKIKKNTWQFAKRQMTWFKKDNRIKWIKTQKEAEKLIKDFLKNK